MKTGLKWFRKTKREGGRVGLHVSAHLVKARVM